MDHFGAECVLLSPLCMTGALFSPDDESVTTAKMVTPFLSLLAQRAQRGAGSSHNLKFNGTHVISFDGIIAPPAPRVKTSKPTESKVVGTGCRHSESGS